MRTVFALLMVAVCFPLHAQWRQDPTTGSSAYQLQDRTILQGQVATTTDFGVRLVDAANTAREKKVVVQAFVDGLELIDPRVATSPNEHQGHIVYKLDAGAEKHTASKRIEIDNVSPGDHTLTLYLADNQGHAISPLHDLKVRIPK